MVIVNSAARFQNQISAPRKADHPERPTMTLGCSLEHAGGILEHSVVLCLPRVRPLGEVMTSGVIITIPKIPNHDNTEDKISPKILGEIVTLGVGISCEAPIITPYISTSVSVAYLHSYTYVHTCIPTCLHTYMPTYMQACIHTRTCTSKCMQSCAYAYAVGI